MRYTHLIYTPISDFPKSNRKRRKETKKKKKKGNKKEENEKKIKLEKTNECNYEKYPVTRR